MRPGTVRPPAAAAEGAAGGCGASAEDGCGCRHREGRGSSEEGGGRRTGRELGRLRDRAWADASGTRQPSRIGGRAVPRGGFSGKGLRGRQAAQAASAAGGLPHSPVAPGRSDGRRTRLRVSAAMTSIV